MKDIFLFESRVASASLPAWAQDEHIGVEFGQKSVHIETCDLDIACTTDHGGFACSRKA